MADRSRPKRARALRIGRAKVMLGEMGFMQSGAEREGVTRVLNVAGWTYVAAFITGETKGSCGVLLR